jgi:hypothetical protein
MELCILISAHNYFIMHDIKYFFSMKIMRQSRGEGQKKFQRETNYRKILFFKIQKRRLSPWTHIHPPLIERIKINEECSVVLVVEDNFSLEEGVPF